MLRNPVLVTLLGLLSLILVSCGGDGESPTPISPAPTAEHQAADEELALLYVQNAVSGSLIPVTGADDTFTLTLEGVSKSTVFFADRPGTVSGHVSTDLFIRNWGTGANSFVVSPPNAALDILGGERTGDVVVVKISEPIYDEEAAQLTYRVKALKNIGTGSLLSFDERRDILEDMPESFGQVGLFIDASGIDAAAVLIGRHCPKCDLTLADLGGADLGGADLSGADLRKANLSGAVLHKANLKATKLMEADLRKASLKLTKMMEADLRKANLIGADLSGANLTGADLTGASVTPASLTLYGPTGGAGADIETVTLTAAIFTHANTTDCKGCP